jgi:hypothetical protein
MRKALVSLSVFLAIAGMLVAPSPANATTPIGPICFSTLPFGDVLVWFLDQQGVTANSVYFDAVGKDLGLTRTQSVSVILDRATRSLLVGYTTHPQPPVVPVIAGGTVDLATGMGPGQCFAPDFASCGAFTFQIIPCPAGAAPENVTGPLQGKPE